ncbi:MAG: WYL domain-containing protein [Flavobacteriales bacterium]
MSVSSARRLTTLRYAVLDECFTRPPGRNPSEPLPRHFKSDLLNLVNQRLREAIPGTKPIAMRTLEKDIQDMQRLFGVKIVRYHEKKRVWYSYAQDGMTIRAAGLTGSEASTLTGALEICSRFTGNQDKAWLPWALEMLRHHFHLDDAQQASRRNQKEAHGWSVGTANRFPAQPELQRILHGLKLGEWCALRLKDKSLLSFLPEHFHFGSHGEFVCGVENRLNADGAVEWWMRVLDWTQIASIESLTEVPKSRDKDRGRIWSDWCRRRFSIRPGEWADENVWNPEAEEVRIWFANDRARELMRRPWHSSQEIRTETAAGGEIFTFHLVVDDSLISAVLSEGPRAQWLEPLATRNDIRDMMVNWPAMYAPMFGP